MNRERARGRSELCREGQHLECAGQRFVALFGWRPCRCGCHARTNARLRAVAADLAEHRSLTVEEAGERIRETREADIDLASRLRRRRESRVKRWLLWTFWCLRGRRCAKLVAHLDTQPILSEVCAGPLPAEVRSAIASTIASIEFEYTCGGCGTHYEGHGDGSRRRIEARA